MRYTRTPDHLLRKVWGGLESTATPALEIEAIATIEIEIEAEIAPCDGLPSADEGDVRPDEFAPEAVVADDDLQLYANISDHAFWDLGPVSGGGLSSPSSEMLPDEPATPRHWDDAEDTAPSAEAVDAGSAPALPEIDVALAAIPGPAPVLSWSQTYTVNLQVGGAAWAETNIATGLRVEGESRSPAEPQMVQAIPAVTKPESEPEPARAGEADEAAVADRPMKRRKAPPPPAPFMQTGGVFELPPLSYLAEPMTQPEAAVSTETLQQNAGLLEGVLEDFNIRGEIVQACPGPVVTLYELEPAPGIKSSRVISLADDIARSMSAISARVAVVQGKNAIGIELPNAKRETVFLRELLASQDFESTKHKLALCLGKTIGGEPVIAD
ncbi:DNA translocase FtsK, partial [Bosea sp. LC85]|uniref:DNA translocase FtsK n=1 Tax=Bosea sp. LC85 TaxID=1502851 RepID=UPI00244D9EB6